MTHARVKPLGWALNEVLTSAQMNSLDTNVSQSIDWNGGGTYALGASIRLEDEIVELEEPAFDEWPIFTSGNSKTVTRSQGLIPIGVSDAQALTPGTPFEGVDWTTTSHGGLSAITGRCWTQDYAPTSGSLGPSIVFACPNLIRGAEIDAMEIVINDPNGGAAATTPAQMHLIELDCDTVSGTPGGHTTLKTQSLASIDRSGYATLTAALAANWAVPDSDVKRLAFVVEGEYGTNAVTGLEVWDVRLRFVIGSLKT